MQQRLGFERCYQLDMIGPMGDDQVRMASSAKGTSWPIITNGFPIVSNVVELPESLRASIDRVDINEDMELEGFYFRLWSFQSAFLDRYAAEQVEANNEQPAA